MLEETLEDCSVLRHVDRRLAAFGAPSRPRLSEAADLAERVHRRGSDLTADLAGPPRIIISGWACQMRPDPKRRRQIFGFLLPGDFIGSFWRRPEFSFFRISALTRITTVCAGGVLTRTAAGGLAFPDLVRAARRAEDHSQHLLIDHLVRLGARDAYAGLAHLFLELHARLERVGLARDGVFTLPVGQRVLAQAMGFSLAHTNYTLQRMIADGLLAVQGEEVRILRPERLIEVGEFAPYASKPSEDGPDAAGAARDGPDVGSERGSDARSVACEEPRSFALRDLTESPFA